MKLLGRLKSNRIIGIDCGDAFTKIVEVRRETDGAPRWIRDALFPTADEATLARMVAEFGMRTVDVRLAFHTDQLKMRAVELPPIPESEVPNAIRIQMKDAREATDPILVRVVRVAHATAAALPKQRWMAFTVPKRSVDEIQEKWRVLGVRPRLIEPGILSLRFTLDANTDDAISVLEVGAKYALFIVMQKGVPVFVRQLPELSGYALTRVIARDMNVPETVAEALKIKYVAEPTTPPGDEWNRLHMSISNFLSRFSIEIQRSMDAYTLSTGVAPRVGGYQIHLSGGGTYLSGLSAYLQQTVGVRVSLLQPSGLFSADSPGAASIKTNERYYSVACGLVR